MGYKDNIVPGWVPHSGAIFTSNIGMKKMCFRHKLFGLPSAMSDFVLHVKKGMILFLFEFERRQLYGVFRATSDGEINILPNAFKSSGRHFPAQVRFTSVWTCNPLDESEFRYAIRDNYFSGKKFNFGLSEDQVYKLMMLFHAKRIPKNHPERNIWRHGDKPAVGDGRFDDHRMNLFRDRLGFISKEDRHGLDICEYLGDEVKEVEDHLYLNANFVEEHNNFNCGRGQRNRTVTVERFQEDNGDRFLTNYITQSDDFGDHSTRQAILGSHLDHALGGLRRVADAGSHDVNDGHNNLAEIRGITNEDRFFMMEKIKVEHDIEDDRHIFNKPHVKHLGKIGAASSDAKFLMDDITSKSKEFEDDNRIPNEYHVINDFWQTINDGRFIGYESEQGTLNQQGTTGVWTKPNYDEGSTFRSRTLTEHPLLRPGAAGIKPRYDYKDFGFGDVSPTNNSIRGVVSTNYIAFSHCKQSAMNSSGNPISEAQDSSISEQLRHPSEFSNIGKTYDCGLPLSTCCDTRMITMPTLYDSEAPDIRLRPSAGRSSSLVDNCPFYPSSKDALLSKNHDKVSCHEARGTQLVEENRVFKNDAFEGSFFSERASLSLSQSETAENVIKSHRSHGFSSRMSLLSGYDSSYLGEPRSKYIHKVSESSPASKMISLSDAGLCSRENDPIRHHKISRQPHEDKHLDGADKRVSVFARLTLAPEAVSHEQEFDSGEHEDQDSLVNNVMEMLEKVVSGPIKRTGKSISAFKHHHDDVMASKIVDYELSKTMMEPDADLADETIEGGSKSILHETRLVDFKRRKKANKNLDDKSEENTAGPIESERSAGNRVSEPDVGSAETNSSMCMPCKRRRLVRPNFVRNESTGDAKNSLPTCNENQPLKDDSNPTEAIESLEKVEVSIESTRVSSGCQKDVIEGEASSEVVGDGNAENGRVSDGNGREQSQEKRDVDGMTRVGSPKGDRTTCGWIEW